MKFEDLNFGLHPIALEMSSVRAAALEQVQGFGPGYIEMQKSAVHATHQFENGWRISVISHRVPEGQFRTFYGNLDANPPTYEVMIWNKQDETAEYDGDPCPLGWQTPEEITAILAWIEEQDRPPPKSAALPGKPKRKMEL
jgi:hypothetical protein